MSGNENNTRTANYDTGLASAPKHIQDKLIIGWASGFFGLTLLVLPLLTGLSVGIKFGSVAALCLALSAIIIGTDAGRNSV